MIFEMYKRLLVAGQKEMGIALAGMIVTAAVQGDREAAVQAETIRFMSVVGYDLLKAEYRSQGHGDGSVESFCGDLLFGSPDLSVIVAVETAYRNYGQATVHNKTKAFHVKQTLRAYEAAKQAYSNSCCIGMIVRNANNGKIVYECVPPGTVTTFVPEGSWEPEMFSSCFLDVGNQGDYLYLCKLFRNLADLYD